MNMVNIMKMKSCLSEYYQTLSIQSAEQVFFDNLSLTSGNRLLASDNRLLASHVSKK